MFKQLIKRIVYLLQSGPAIDRLIEAEENRIADEYRKDNRYRLNLCRKHRQEQNHSEYSESNCHHCQLLNHADALRATNQRLEDLLREKNTSSVES